ncbi:MAG: glucosyltransferase domain-containing protein [Brucella anthropi]
MIVGVFSRFNTSHILLCLIVCLLAYGSNAWYPTFNADDIIQTQSMSGDSATFMGQGRWGYYLVFHFLQGENPSGPFALFLGLTLIFSSGLVAADALGLAKQATALLFSLVSSVSIYYGHLFIFDSVWLSYPIGITLASLSASMIIKQRRYVLSVLLLSASPAFYQPAIQIFVALLICKGLLIIPRDGLATTIRQLAIAALVVLISLIAYILSTKAASSISGIPLWDRSKVDVVGALANYRRIIDLLLYQSLPFNSGVHEYYFPWTFRLIVSVAFIACLVTFLNVCLKSHTKITAILLGLALLVCLSISPFLLALASPLDQFGPRSLIAFSTVHAFYICSCLHWLKTNQTTFSNETREKFSTFMYSLGISLVTVSALQSSKFSYDNTLAWQQDRLTVNRMIMRIDDVIKDTTLASQPALRIAVRFDQPVNSGPRGEILSARYSPWSQEWVFRLLDSRFVRAGDTERAPVIQRSLDRPKWPAQGSVYMDEGIIVVVVN